MSEKTKKALAELKKLRDEIRVKIDLAGKETKTWWDGLEPQISSMEEKVLEGSEKVADVSKAVAEEMASAFRRIRDRVNASSDAAAVDAAEDDDAPAADDDGATDAEIID